MHAKEVRVFDGNIPVEVFDDTFTVDISLPTSFLRSVDYEGICMSSFNFPDMEQIRIPGLNDPVFYCPKVPLYLESGQATSYVTINLPGIYSIINSALKVRDRAKEKNDPYIWESYSDRFRSELRSELLSLLEQIFVEKYLHSREGFGFQALSQVNPNLDENTLQVGLGLANEWLLACQKKSPGQFQTVTDLNGLLLDDVVRYPITTSKSIQTGMHMIVGGRGKCVYVNPNTLKNWWKGDVDGDILIITAKQPFEIRNLPVSKRLIPVPTEVNELIGDIDLYDVKNNQADKWDVYLGLAGKEGIGEITNATYRMTILAPILYRTKETREEFLSYCGEPIDIDLDNDEQFKHKAACMIMDSMGCFYEAAFDARKDISVLKYIRCLLEPIRNSSKDFDWDILEAFSWEGKYVNIKPLKHIWDTCGHSFSRKLRQYPAQNYMFINGANKKASGNRKSIKSLISLFPENTIEHLIKEWNGEQFISETI